MHIFNMISVSGKISMSFLMDFCSHKQYCNVHMYSNSALTMPYNNSSILPIITCYAPTITVSFFLFFIFCYWIGNMTRTYNLKVAIVSTFLCAPNFSLQKYYSSYFFVDLFGV